MICVPDSPGSRVAAVGIVSTTDPSSLRWIVIEAIPVTVTGSLNVKTMFVSAETPTAPLVGDVAIRMGGAESRERIASKASTVPPETSRPFSWLLGWAESTKA